MEVAGIEFPGLETTGRKFGCVTGWRCACGWEASSGALIGPEQGREAYRDLRMHAQMCPKASDPDG